MVPATYLSALIVVVASIAVGRALTRLLGWRGVTWLEPVVGLALLAVVGSFSIRALNSGGATAVVLGVLIVASLAYLRLRLLPGAALRVAGLPALIAAAAASLPLLANLRIGIFGVGINNDLASHLLWAEWLRDQPDPMPVSLDNGYPIGPHSLAASLGQAFGFEMTDVIAGLLIAVAALTAITALAVLRELPPGRRLIGTTLVALPYMTASALAVGGFKETTIGLLVLGFALALARLEREWPGDRTLTVSLGVIAAGAISVYSYPGLYWLIAAAGLLALAGLVRASRTDRPRVASRAGLGVAVAALVVFAIVAASEFPRAVTFNERSGVQHTIEGDSKLRDAVSPLESLGVWPDSNFLAGTSGPELWPLFGLIGLVALLVALPWWLGRGRFAVPLGVLGAFVIYLGALAEGGLYVQGKALAVPASLVMLMIVLPLLEQQPAPDARQRERPSDRRTQPAAARWDLARPLLAGVFVVLATVSSFFALRDAIVAPNEHADELGPIRERIAGDWTLSLTTDRFTDYQLRTTRVGGPSRNSQVIFPARNGKDFRLPLDFDSIAPATLDVVTWVLTTKAAYRSEPPPNLELVESTDSYELWQRTGPTPFNTRVFGEEARPGKVLKCSAEDLQIARRRRVATKATVFEPTPVIGKRRDWEPSNNLRPGDSVSQTLELPPGDWQLSLQYQSPIGGLKLEVKGQTLELPAAMDGAIPYRFGEGPFWPVGKVQSDGAPLELTVRAEDASTLQKLLGVDRAAFVGNVVATRIDPYVTVPFSRACGEYVDHFWVPKDKVLKKPGRIYGARRAAAEALTGHYQPLTPEELAEKKAKHGRPGA